MADRSSLKFVGFIFATVTLGGDADHRHGGEGLCRRRYTLEDTAFVRQ